MFYTHLPQRGLLFITGADAYSFLQGLITQDIRLLEAGKPVYAALLSPQGKYLHDFFLYPRTDGILLDGEKARLSDLQSRLKLYKLRSDVTIETLPEEQGIVALWNRSSESIVQSSGNVFTDPRQLQLGWRMAGDVTANLNWCSEQGFSKTTPDDYDIMRLKLGVPDGSRDLILDRSFMLECGMDKLGAVNFEKGCYVGQEVTARSRFRGQLRKMLFSVTAAEGELPEAGTPIFLADEEAGQMRSHNGDIGLAVLRVELVEKAKAEKLLFSAGATKLSASLPAWHETGISGAQNHA